ncbi:MAG: hypothetical protein KGJ35_03660, partial [Patescibacteria group bacterium]|nr:hypothetical protein [Patescibacteria group bacterium]
MNFLYKKTISNMQLVVDIESDYVRATVLVGDIETPMQVVFSTNTEIIRKAHTDGLYLTRNMLSALAKTMQSVSSAIAQSRELFQKSRPDSITIILSSPWVISRLVCVKQLFETNVEINHSMISKMIEDEKDKNNQIFANGDSEVIEHVFFDVKINGYPVTNYQGTSGRSLEGTLVTSFGPRGLLSEIT